MTAVKSDNLSRTSHRRHYFRGVPRIAAATLAGCAIIGMTEGAPYVTAALSRRLIAMDTGTAVGFLLCALALLVAQRRSSTPVLTMRFAVESSLLLLGLNGLYGVDTALSRLSPGIMSNGLAVPAAGVDGSMATGTALAFQLAALALLADHRQTGNARAVSRLLATLVFLTGLTALLGYAYGAPRLYLGLDGTAPMSLLSATLVIVMALGIVSLRAQYGFPAMLAEQSVVGTHVRAVLPMVLGAPLLVGAAVAVGYGKLYTGEFAIALTSLGSLAAAGLVAVVSIVVLRKADNALYMRDRALQAATTGVVITDHRALDEPIVYTNDAFTQISGYTADEALGKNCRFLNRSVQNDPNMLEAIRHCIATGGDGVFELHNQRKDGTLFWNRLSLAPVRNYEATVTHYVGIMDDITWRHNQETQLHKALEQAREAGEMRETLVSLVSHELRAPLNAALTWVRLMELDREPDTQDRGLAVIAQSIESQSRLIDDLVDVTRFERSGVGLESTQVDARELIEMTVEESRPAIEPAKTLILKVASGDYAAWLDPLRVRQIVRNLLSNAGKYTPDGGRITVQLDSAAGWLELRVTDTGKGLTDTERARIFKPFWRADARLPGLGVGLSISTSLVRAHGGTISVHSDGPGQGTTFTVRLPRDTPNQSASGLGSNDASVTAADSTE